MVVFFIAPLIAKKNSSGSPEVASGLYIAAGYQSFFDNCFRQFYAQKTLCIGKSRFTAKLKIVCYIKFSSKCKIKQITLLFTLIENHVYLNIAELITG